jgi:hypothetical protein
MKVEATPPAFNLPTRGVWMGPIYRCDLPGPPELGAVNPDALHDHGQPALGLRWPSPRRLGIFTATLSQDQFVERTNGIAPRYSASAASRPIDVWRVSAQTRPLPTWNSRG